MTLTYRLIVAHERFHCVVGKYEEAKVIVRQSFIRSFNYTLFQKMMSPQEQSRYPRKAQNIDVNDPSNWEDGLAVEDNCESFYLFFPYLISFFAKMFIFLVLLLLILKIKILVVKVVLIFVVNIYSLISNIFKLQSFCLILKMCDCSSYMFLK